jgi:cell division protein FtsB
MKTGHQNLILHIRRVLRISHQSSVISAFLILIFILAVSGCNKANEKAQMLDKIEQLTEQNKELTGALVQSKSENEQLKGQVNVLSSLPDEVKGENLYSLQKIKIGRYTDFYDKDDDGKKETLIVYIQTIDEQGDKMKAPGTAEVELWDLNKQDGQAMLARWKVEQEELKKLWYATMLTINYRLTFDITEVVKSFNKPLTVKAKFIDHLTGRTFEDQRVIKP